VARVRRLVRRDRRRARALDRLAPREPDNERARHRQTAVQTGGRSVQRTLSARQARRGRTDRRPILDPYRRRRRLQTIRAERRAAGRCDRRHLPHLDLLRDPRPDARLARPARDADHGSTPAKRRQAAERRSARQRPGRLPRRDDRQRHARPRLQRPLAARPQVRRAAGRVARSARDPDPRIRSGRRRSRPAADGDRLDHRCARALRPDRGRVLALGVLREHAHRDGALRSGSTTPCSSSRATARNAATDGSSTTRSPPPARPPAAPCCSAARRS
jgi:hypothetical protein